MFDTQNDVGIHLQETTVGVVSETFVAGSFRQTFDGFVVQAQVQNRVHHARHGNTGAGTHGKQQGIVRIGEFFADDGFTMFDAFLNLFFQIRGERFAVRIIIRANFGRNRKARGNGNSDSAHFSQVRTFAAQQISVGSVTFGFSVAEFINPFCHGG